jgi:glycosyltransferase involved in cell wall biosynthesis
VNPQVPSVKEPSLSLRPLRVGIACAESMADGYAPSAHVNGIADALRGLGHEVRVIGQDSGPYHDAGLTGRLLRYAKINRRAKAALQGMDIMLARAHFAHWPWVRAAERRGIPVVHEMNGLMFDAATTYRWLRPAQDLINRSYRAQFARAAGVACITGEIAAHVRAQGLNVPISIVGNGVDAALFHPPAVPPAGEMTAIFPSALAPWHGINTLLAAVEDPAWPAQLTLVIAGDGVQADAVIQRAKTNPRIRYVGLLGRHKLAEHLREATIGLCLVETMEHRGISEVYPLKLFELMASGLPIIATDLPGQREMVREAGAGLIVPPHDSAALAAAVRDLLAREDRCAMGLAGATAVRTQHNWRIRAIELERILRKALNSPAATA